MLDGQVIEVSFHCAIAYSDDMPQSRANRFHFRPSLAFVLLCIFLSALWIAGGASRGDVSGQVIVRGVAWVLIAIGALFAPPPRLSEVRPVLLILLAAVALALVQLIPLPPAVWQALPGRDLVVHAAVVSGQPQPWRPWSMVPDATVNAASSLVVAAAMLWLVASLKERERAWLPGMILAGIAVSTMVGLLQFSGGGFGNPLVNDTVGEVSGNFANRNHFALFMALGCLLAPVWAFREEAIPGWRMLAALGLVPLFILTILASGSRAGLLLGGLGIALGLVIVRHDVRQLLGRYPRWVFTAIMVGIVLMMVIFVLLSVVANRAVSIDRLFAIDAGQDMRSRSLLTVLAMIRTYFPFGSGLGGFDPIFRISEPFDLLGLTYFNHAHNDFLEIALDAGLSGLIVLLAGLGWWGWASARAWLAGSGARNAMPKLGAAMLLLVIVASLFDYPARTPLMMAMVVVAGAWLATPAKACSGSALPSSD